MGELGIILFPECPNKKTLSKYQHSDRNGHSSARFKSNSSPVHMSLPEVDILCADHAMLKNPSRSCRGNENFEKNGEGHMWEWCEIMTINTKSNK